MKHQKFVVILIHGRYVFTVDALALGLMHNCKWRVII